MRKISSLLLLFLLIATITSAQKSVTFAIEKLSSPLTLLPVDDYNTILEKLIETEAGVTDKQDAVKISYNIVAKSRMPAKMVEFGYSSFFRGMYTAYSDHRPFTLSPDMIWLLISQGFANHVNYNSNALRSMFVKFNGQATLLVRHDGIDINNPNSPWEEMFPLFREQINKQTGGELANVLTANFTTTTPATKVASQITMMNALNTYFNYSMIMGCGIPQVTLEGTTADWQNVLTKTEALRKYKLDWWVDELVPVLKQFIAASKGKVDKPFWQEMFKYHRQETKCAPGTIIDGWIVKFYPYNHKGQRNDLKTIIKAAGGDDQMPDEVIKVNLDYIGPNGEEVPLELWAGFVGLEQNNENFGLKPSIGWMIRKRDLIRPGILQRLQHQNKYANTVTLRVTKVPAEVMQIGPIKSLTIYFSDKINIPDTLASIKIDRLYLNGEVSPEETARIVKLFPNTKVVFSTRDDL